MDVPDGIFAVTVLHCQVTLSASQLHVVVMEGERTNSVRGAAGDASQAVRHHYCVQRTVV